MSLITGPDAADALYVGNATVSAVYHGSDLVWEPDTGTSDPLAGISGRIMHLRAKDTVGAEGADVTAWTDAFASVNYLTTNAYPKARPTGTPNGGRAVRFDTGYLRPSVTNIMFTDVEVLALTASSQFNTGYPPSSVAGRYGDWATSGFTNPEWFRIQLAAPRVIDEYSLYSDLGGRSPLNWNLRGSNDGVNWDILDSRAGTPPSGLQTYTCSNTTAYTWYELQFTAINGGDLLYMRRIDLDGLSFSGTPLSTAECWIVLKSLGTGSGHPISITGGDTRYPYNDGWIYSSFGGGRVAYAPSMPLDTWRIYRMQYNTGVHTEWLDGVQQNTSSVGGPSWITNGPLIGTGNNVPCYMDLAEFLMFNRTLSTGEAVAVSSYLTDEHFT